MSETSNDTQTSVWMPHGWREIEGTPNPGLEHAVDKAIYKVMVDQRREANRRNLPDLED